MTNEDNYVLPTNVKQIGTINDNTSRIYMEDYAQTYIDQYAASDITRERIAILIGKKIQAEGDEVLFISGVIQGKYTIKKNNMLELTEKSWQYVKKQMSMYFSGLEIVGWVYIQPGFEDYIGENICTFQKKNKDRGLEVLYIADPSEHINSFYNWNDETKMFNQIKGYIVYYEKNEGMHEYMLENKIKTVKKEIPQKTISDAGAAARAVASTKRSKYRTGSRISADSRKMVNLLGGVSFIMLMVCFVMGAGLIQNDERINNLEEKISFLEADFKESQDVFASQTLSEATTQPSSVSSTQSETNEPTTVKTATEESYKKYVVKTGDTLIKICKNTYGDAAKIDEIKEINSIKDNTIVVGETLLLP